MNFLIQKFFAHPQFLGEKLLPQKLKMFFFCEKRRLHKSEFFDPLARCHALRDSF